MPSRAIKWLRVAQREHYLAGSIIFMRRVWIAGRPANAIEAVMLVGALVGHALAPDSFWPLLGCAGMVVLPIGLGYRGRTSPLNWTARLRRTAVVGAILLGLATLLLGWMSTLWLGGGWPGALSMAAVVSWYAIPDLVLWMAAPIERRLSQKFVVRAAGTLDRVAPVVVGITGSYGKTSTKWYVRDLVSGTRRVVASPASFNNRLGLARAINENLTDDAEVFVAEMGAYQPGEIADTCSWIPPRIAVPDRHRAGSPATVQVGGAHRRSQVRDLRAGRGGDHQRRSSGAGGPGRAHAWPEGVAVRNLRGSHGRAGPPGWPTPDHRGARPGAR